MLFAYIAPTSIVRTLQTPRPVCLAETNLVARSVVSVPKVPDLRECLCHLNLESGFKVSVRGMMYRFERSDLAWNLNSR